MHTVSRFGGHALFIKDKKLYYVYNFLGIKPVQQFVSPELEPGKYTLGMEFAREKAGQYHESLGTTHTVRQRQGGSQRPDADAARQVHSFWRTVFASDATVATLSARVQSSRNGLRGEQSSALGSLLRKAQYQDLETLAAGSTRARLGPTETRELEALYVPAW